MECADLQLSCICLPVCLVIATAFSGTGHVDNPMLRLVFVGVVRIPCKCWGCAQLFLVKLYRVHNIISSGSDGHTSDR